MALTPTGTKYLQKPVQKFAGLSLGFTGTRDLVMGLVSPTSVLADHEIMGFDFKVESNYI